MAMKWDGMGWDGMGVFLALSAGALYDALSDGFRPSVLLLFFSLSFEVLLDAGRLWLMSCPYLGRQAGRREVSIGIYGMVSYGMV